MLIYFLIILMEAQYSLPAQRLNQLPHQHTHTLAKIPASTLNDIMYTIDLMVVENELNGTHLKEILTLEGIEAKRASKWLGKFPGLIRPTLFDWEIRQTK